MFSTATNHYSYLSTVPLNDEPRHGTQPGAAGTSRERPPLVLEWHGDAQQLAQELCQRLVSHLDLDFSVYYRMEAGEQALVLAHQSGLPEGTVTGIRRLPFSPAIQRDALSAAGLSVPAAVDAGERMEGSVSGPLKATDFSGFLVLVDGRVVGCLGAGKCRHKRIQEAERREIATAALQIAVALDHARLQAFAAALEGRLAGQEQRRREMVATLAHELRNPLGALNYALYVLLASPSDTPRFRRAGEIAARQIRHQAHLIDGLLETSRLDAGQVTLRREPLDLGELAREAVEAQCPACEEAELALEVLLPGEPVSVAGDRARLRQVLTSLLENARRLTPAGGRIIVQLHELPEGTVALTVRDTGVGMEPGFLHTLFEPFVQADQSLARSGGLGLGLSIARRLVELHGGTLRAQSTGLGYGAEFTVTLPRHTAAPPAPESHNTYF